MKIKRIITALTAFIMLFVFITAFYGCGKTEGKMHHAQIIIKDYGTVTLELDGTQAPITVAHFIDMANKGVYNNSHFIRMQQGFVLQGGDTASTETIKGEFTENGVNNTIKHTTGVISMARGNENDTGTTQFFLVLSDDAGASLDGKYAGFGHVTEGWEIIEKICSDIKSSDFDESYYGYYMGFLKTDSYITIESVKVID